jgi:hypothetical protein
MYSKQELKALMDTLATQHTLTAQDVHKARDLYHDAKDRRQSVQEEIDAALHQYRHVPANQKAAYMASLYDTLQECKFIEHDAQKMYTDVHTRGGYLLAQEHAASAQADEAKRRAADQERERARLEQEAREQARTYYINAGGSERQFEAAWPDMWNAELLRRTQEQRGLMDEKLRKSGRYSGG